MSEEIVIRESLADGDSGRWLVRTESSTYLLDLDAREVTRMPGADPQPVPGVSTASLREDHAKTGLLSLGDCRVGHPIRLVIQLPGRDFATLRVTTFVLGVTPAPVVVPERPELVP